MGSCDEGFDSSENLSVGPPLLPERIRPTVPLGARYVRLTPGQFLCGEVSVPSPREKGSAPLTPVLPSP